MLVVLQMFDSFSSGRSVCARRRSGLSTVVQIETGVIFHVHNILHVTIL